MMEKVPRAQRGTATMQEARRAAAGGRGDGAVGGIHEEGAPFASTGLSFAASR
jgi:hypothetical protein